MKKVYDIVVDQIINKLENGFIPWQQTWIGGEPCNYVTGTSYNGFNKLVLSMNEFGDHRYLTVKQIKDLGGYIKPGSHGTKIIYFKLQKKKDSEEEYPILRYYNIFNVEQTAGIKIEEMKQNGSKTQLHKAQTIVTGYKDKPTIANGNRASYNIGKDKITIPSLFKFDTNESYFATLFHEMIHSTGSVNRLARFQTGTIEYYGSENYSKEELIAELGAYFLSMKAGIDNKVGENSKNYLAGWLNHIKGNKKDLVNACSQAQKASDYILGK